MLKVSKSTIVLMICVALPALATAQTLNDEQSPFFAEFQKAISDGDMKSAKQLLHENANKGDAEAECLLGSMSARGIIVAQDYTAAANWLFKSSDTCLLAPLYLGFMHRDGLGVDQNKIQAAQWFRKFKLRAPDAPIQKMRLPDHKDVTADMAAASLWVRENLHNKSSDELMTMARSYEPGKGVAKDREIYIHILNLAAKAGSNDAQSIISALKSANDPLIQALLPDKAPPHKVRATVQ